MKLSDKDQNIPQRIALVNAYTATALIYCASFSVIFRSIDQNIFLSNIHLLAFLVVGINYLVLRRTNNFKTANTVILIVGTGVVLSLFATGGWEGTGYLWPFAYLPFAFFLSDRRNTMFWVGALLAGCIVIAALSLFKTIVAPYSAVAYFNYFTALVIFIICLYYFLKATAEAEIALLESEEQIQTVFNSAPDAVIVIDEDGKIEQWNPKAETLFGWKAAEVTGKLLSQIIIPHRYRDAHAMGLKHFLETKVGPVLGKTIEVQALKKNDLEFDVALSISPTIMNGKYLFIGFLRDITEQKKIEDKISQNERMFSALFYKSPVMKAITDESTGRFIEVNDAFADFWGHTKEDILGKTSLELNMLVHGDERDQQMKRARENGFRFVRNAEINVNTRDGNRWLSVSVDAITLNGKDCFLTAGIDITTRKEAEEKLREVNSDLEKRVQEKTHQVMANERRFRAMIEKNTDMMTLTTPKGKLLYASPSLTSILGYTQEELATTSTFELIHPDDVPDMIEQTRTIIDSPGRSVYRQQRILHKNGTWIWCEGTITNMLHDSNIGALVSNFRDITERKETEEQLSSERILLRSLIDNLPDYIYVKDTQFRYVITNQSFVHLIGATSEEETIGKQSTDVLNREAAEINMEEDRNVVRSGKPVIDRDEPLVTTTGERRWLLTTKVPLKNHEGNVISILGISKDITERKQAEEKILALNEKLSKSEKIYKTIASSIPGSVILLFDKDFRYLLIEGDMLEKFGYSKEQLLGQRIEDVLEPELQAILASNFKRVFRDETFATENDQGEFQVLTKYVPLKDEDLKVYAAMVIVIDITEVRKAERRITELNVELEQKVIQRTAQLESVNKELEAFSYSISHDLRAPLRSISGFAAMLEEDYGTIFDENGKRLLGTVQSNARRMGQLIDDLLAFSKLGRKEINKAEINMTALVKDIAEEIKAANPGSEIKIGDLHKAKGEAILLRQVWYNYISNAVKYSSKSENSLVEIKSMIKNGEVIYSVRDNGTGFDMAYANKLFKVFQRLHSHDQYEGTGVGLAIVDRIIGKHRGKVWAEGKTGEGATFYFSLPT